MDPRANDELLLGATEKVRRIRHLARLPDAARRTAERAQDPECSPAELAATFASDPVLASQLLRVANSSYYGLRASVSSIEHAGNLLGRMRLRNIALASSLGPMMCRKSPHGDLSFEVLWRHSLSAAAAARSLARHVGGVDPEQAFTAGLVHDLGMLVEAQLDPAGIAEVLDRHVAGAQATLAELERAHFGFDHGLLGAALCAEWGFPAELSACVRWHDDPCAAPEELRTLAAVVHVAEALVEGPDHGVVAVPRCKADPAACALLGLTPEDLEALREPLEAQIAAALSAF